MSIPKIIHYCWFGGKSKPDLALRCIETWKKYCPDYEIIEWSETNYDISSAPLYVRQAYASQKWAFVTDYVRLKVVYDHGGIYLDTDVELLGSLDEFLENQAFFGFESVQTVATGLGFGAVPGASVIFDIASDYDDIPFIQPDGSFDLTPCPKRNTEVLFRYGLVADGTIQVLPGGIAIYPPEYFNPKNYESGRITLTNNTVSIHHFDGSWQSEKQKKERREYRIVTRIFGVRTGERLLLARNILVSEGVIALWKRIKQKLRK